MNFSLRLGFCQIEFNRYTVYFVVHKTRAIRSTSGPERCRLWLPNRVWLVANRSQINSSLCPIDGRYGLIGWLLDWR